MNARWYSRGLASCAAALVLAGAACNPEGGPERPGAPAPLPTPQARASAPPSPDPGTLAVLQIVEFRDGPGAYGVKLVLAETGGRSGAYIETPVLIGADGQTKDYGCGGLERIEPGGTWDMDTLSYCAPTGDGSAEGMKVVVTYVDDEGLRGTLEATMPVLR